MTCKAEGGSLYMSAHELTGLRPGARDRHGVVPEDRGMRPPAGGRWAMDHFDIDPIVPTPGREHVGFYEQDGLMTDHDPTHFVTTTRESGPHIVEITCQCGHVLALDWAYVPPSVETAALVRADERERIAQAIEAECVHDRGAGGPDGWTPCYRCERAARIARNGGAE